MGWGGTPTDLTWDGTEVARLSDFKFDEMILGENGFPEVQKKLNDLLEPGTPPGPTRSELGIPEPTYKEKCDGFWLRFEEEPEELDRRRRNITNVAYRFLTAFAYCRLLAKKIEEEGINLSLFHDSSNNAPALWGQVADSVRTILERSGTSKEELREEIEAIQPDGFWEAEYRGLSFMEAEDLEAFYEKHNEIYKKAQAQVERQQMRLDKWHHDRLVQQEKMEQERLEKEGTQEETIRSRVQEELDQLSRQSVEALDGEQHGERTRVMLQLQQPSQSSGDETPRPPQISLGPQQPMRVQKRLKKGKTQLLQQRHEKKQSDNATQKSSRKISGTSNNSIKDGSCTPASKNAMSKVSRIMDGLSTDAIIGDSSGGRPLRNTRARQATFTNSGSRTNTGVLCGNVDSKVSKQKLKPRRQVTRSKALVP